MLTATVLQLGVPKPLELPAVQGRAIHAWFLERVAQVAPALAERLHEGSALRPFTLSDLWAPSPPRVGYFSLAPGQNCQLRLTTLTEELTEAWLRALPQEGEHIPLAGGELVVQRVWQRAEEHPWAGQVSYPELLQRQVLRGKRLPRQLVLSFVSPTLFHSQGQDLPLPLPELVFGGYLSKWNRFAPIQLPEELRQVVREQVSLGRFHLQSRLVSFEAGQKGSHVGYVGEVTFRLRTEEPYWLLLLHLLGTYSFWCGTGRRTSMGLGQTRPWKENLQNGKQ